LTLGTNAVPRFTGVVDDPAIPACRYLRVFFADSC
jgi:hypothetical protein